MAVEAYPKFDWARRGLHRAAFRCFTM